MPNQIVQQTEVAPGVHFVQGPASNWTILTADTDVVLVDAGYPADLDLVLESIVRAGRTPEQLSSILVTHGHSDHIGTVAALVERFGPRVYGHPAELANIRRTELHQIGVADILPRLWRPRVARWTVHAIRAGGLAPGIGVAAAEPFPDDAAMTFAGHAVQAIPVAGHTPGHTVYFLPDSSALITGDAIVTAHPTVKGTGPQQLAPMWHSSADAARASLATITSLEARHILPGHGPLLEASPAHAVGVALGSVALGSTE